MEKPENSLKFRAGINNNFLMPGGWMRRWQEVHCTGAKPS
jgi:hypothetical protein